MFVALDSFMHDAEGIECLQHWIPLCTMPKASNVCSIGFFYARCRRHRMFVALDSFMHDAEGIECLQHWIPLCTMPKASNVNCGVRTLLPAEGRRPDANS